MSRARSAIAVKTAVEKLRAYAAEAFGVQIVETQSFDDFFDAVQFCQPRVEDFGGEEGSNAWYLWKHGPWAIIGDLDLKLPHQSDALAKLSEAFGEAIAAGVDEDFAQAAFVYAQNGKIRRRIALGEHELEIEGRPIQAEVGHRVENFDEQEADRLWQTFGLPTFEFEPEEGPFTCLHVKA